MWRPIGLEFSGRSLRHRQVQHTMKSSAGAHFCPPARCEHGALREGVPLRNTRFAEADLHGASTGREVAHRLAYPLRGRGVTAVPRPAPLTKQEAPQDPRQDLTSGWWNRDRNVVGPPKAYADRDDFKIPLKRQDLDSYGGATGDVGRRRQTPTWKA